MARTFHFRNKETWIQLYKMYVRPHLEFAVPSWNPWTSRDKEMLEKVQMKALKMCTELKGKTYREKLQETDMFTLETRRLQFDLIQVWKILHGHDRVDERIWFKRAQENANRTTRITSSKMNLKKQKANLEIRRNIFSIQITDEWNRLPEEKKEYLSFKRKLEQNLKQRIKV